MCPISFIGEINGRPLSDLESIFFVCLHYKKRFADCAFFLCKMTHLHREPRPDCGLHCCYSSCCFPLQKLARPFLIIS